MAATPALTLKQDDTAPALQATLSDSNGPINLTNATSVKLVMKGNNTATVVVGTCTITNAAQGQVSYTFTAGNTATPDVYQVEFEITWSGGGEQTVPNAAAANPTIEIDAELGD